MKKNLVVFASGSGSNAINVCEYFKDHPSIQVVAIFCNNPQAGIIEKIKSYPVPLVLFSKSEFLNENDFTKKLSLFEPNLIALLGFLWKIPAYLVQAYPRKIVNLHPALLPKFGGKGMYGHFVHEAVKAANETHSGITIHWVNEQYDEGEMIAQFTFDIKPSDEVKDIAEKIHGLEQKHVPQILEKVLMSEEN